MSALAQPLDLSPGAVLVLDGVEWTVEWFQPHVGQVLLGRGKHERMKTTVRVLINHPGVRPSTRSSALPATSQGRQPATLKDLTPTQLEWVRLRFAHVQEAETGFRSGDPHRALPGEPRPHYDPERTTLTERRLVKVAELKALGPDEARAIGFAQVSERTLKRLGSACRRYGMLACVNGRWLRRGGGRPSITEQVREAIYAVREETQHRARVTMKTKELLIHQYVRENYGPDIAVPSYPTLRRVWIEWFGPGGARQRYARSATATPAPGGHIVVHRPGQVVALDTTLLPVKVRETVFGDPVSVHLTLALDVNTHSLVAFRLTLVSDTSVDVAMVLRDVMMPLPLREDWEDELEWPYPGIPAAIVAEFAGHRVAALPFFTPEIVTTDHGSVYKNHHLVEVQRVIGANILPARVLRPTDKHAVERAFAGIQSLLFEKLLGYQGVDVADRGVDPDRDAVLTIAEMEHLIATWIVRIWQNRALGEHAPAWDPGGTHSPNTLFAAAMAQGGFALEIPVPELYYELLPVHHVKIHGDRGVKIRGLWYDGEALDDYRREPSARGGRHKGQWVVRRDPRDRRYAFFQDPRTHEWRTLRWTGLPAATELLSFGDARVNEVLHAARNAGLKPRSDAELLPLLLELMGSHTPVESWPTQMPKHKRVEHAREVVQGEAAAVDRPHAPEASVTGGSTTGGTVVALTWPDRAQHTVHAIDAERRRRREAAVPSRPTPPPLLGEALRRSSLFHLPDEDDEQDPHEHGSEKR